MDWVSSSRPFILGHRGASADAPENTIAAFLLAQQQGADGVELDVQLSADGWPVVMHDKFVRRTTKGQGAVASLSVVELQALDAGQGQPVPTLDEVFEALGPSFLYNIELKSFSWRDSGLEAAVADRIQAHHLENQVLVSSFNPLHLWRGRRHLTRSTQMAHIWTTRWGKHKHWLVDAQATHPHYSQVNEKLMTWAKETGKRVHVWTVDDPSEANRLIDLGVHAIITNKPQLVRESLESRP